MVSHHPVKFCGHSSYCDRDIMFAVAEEEGCKCSLKDIA